MKKGFTILIIAVVVVAVLGFTIVRMTGLAFGLPEGCTDSDKTSEYPDGKNYFVQGEISYANRDVSYEDYCTYSGKKVNEYYCHSDNQIKSVRQLCDNECVDGACIE